MTHNLHTDYTHLNPSLFVYHFTTRKDMAKSKLSIFSQIVSFFRKISWGNNYRDT